MTGDVLASRRQWAILTGCCLERLKELPDGCVSCCVTSPPYFALRAYLPAGHPDKAKEIGSEPTPAAFCATMVAVFEEVKRVLRPDGVCWVNLGDSYAGSSMTGGTSSKEGSEKRANILFAREGAGKVAGRGANRDGDAVPGVAAKNLLMIPARVAIALQESGWWLRQYIPWCKRSAMPSSVTDRPSSALEYVFMLTKSARYYFDMEAAKKDAKYPNDKRRPLGSEGAWQIDGRAKGENGGGKPYDHDTDSRNFRNTDLWFDSIDTPHGLCGIDDELVGLDVTSEALKEAHFAAFPTKLVEPLIKCGSSEKGVCPTCGAPWRRVVEKKREATRPAKKSKVLEYQEAVAANKGKQRGPTINEVVGNRDPQRHCTTTATLGWKQSCKCPDHEPIPSLILDPFCGAATTGLVALRLGRRFIGIELNQQYVELGTKRLVNDNPLFNGFMESQP